MTQIEFFYDFSSPYSYLASTQMEGLEKRAGAPTFFVGEEMFWGNDRIEMVEDFLKTLR